LDRLLDFLLLGPQQLLRILLPIVKENLLQRPTIQNILYLFVLALRAFSRAADKSGKQSAVLLINAVQ